METLLDAVTEDTTGTGVSHTGPATVFVIGVFDGATVNIEAAYEDVSGSYLPCDRIGQITQPRMLNVDAQGTYYLRSNVKNAGENTNITVKTTQ